MPAYLKVIVGGWKSEVGRSLRKDEGEGMKDKGQGGASLRVANILKMFRKGNDIRLSLPTAGRRHPEARGISRGPIYVNSI
ncbi:hypothetical protein [Aquiflexum sp.]|uniref:hypothetical protein n=1 Tax=Aquiflexum sp. TaxID=1872584 RepID=UPI0035931142